MPGTIGANVHVDDVELRSNNLPSGRLITEYEVSTVYDVRNLKQVARYVVTCRQRVIIANKTAGQYNDQQPTSYDNYPILMTNVIEPKKLKSRAEIEQEVKDGIERIKELLNKRLATAIEPEELEEDADGIFDFWSELDRHDCQLQDYSPRTIDTSVSSNLSGNDSASQSSSIQHTLGSSVSQTNTHSTSHTHIWKPFGGSKTTSNDKSIGADVDGSSGSGQSAEDDQQSGLADSMSLKAWGAYASVNTDNVGVSWAWGQEYPWNIFYFNAQGSDPTGDIDLPAYVVDRLYNEPFVLPPSDLSLFGLDFISVARWIITPPEPAAFGDKMKFDTDLSVYLASHGLVPSTNGGEPTFSASLNLDPDTATHRSKTLNLTLLGLAPILGEGGDANATIGFNPVHFTVPPREGEAFRIHSGVNNLCVIGKRFTQGTDDVGVTADLASGATAELHIYFKVLDPEQQLVLFMRHWKQDNSSIQMTTRINDSATVERHIDAAAIADGSQNVTVVTLRNTDFSSYEYFNYLKMGLNHLHIKLRADDSTATSCGYLLHSLAIG